MATVEFGPETFPGIAPLVPNNPAKLNEEDMLSINAMADELRLSHGVDDQAAAGAFDGLYGKLHPHMAKFACSIVKDVDLAADVANEAFLRLWRNPVLYEPVEGSGFNAWITRVTRNIAFDEIRKNRRLVPVEDVICEDSSTGLDETHEKVASLEVLRRAYEYLGRSDSSASTAPSGSLVARDAFGMEQAEEAERFGITSKSLTERRSRTRKNLREQITC